MQPPVANETAAFRVRRRSVLATLTVVAGALLILHFAAMYAWFVLDDRLLLGFTPVLNVDEEVSLATFQQIVQLLVICLLLFALGTASHRRAPADSAAWLSMAAIAFYFAADESATLHETLTPLLRRTVEVGGLLYLPWLALATALIIVFIRWHVPLLRRLDRRTRNGLLLGAVLFGIGAVGLDAAGSAFVERRSALDLVVLAPIEEAMEVGGQLIVLSALLRYAARTQPVSSVHVLDVATERA
jgi:hypothetical protein